MLRLMLLVCIGLGILSCGDDFDCEVEYSEPFTAKVGQEYCFPDGSTLLITEINSSYCPCNAECIWQGETVVVVNWRDSMGIQSELMIHEELLDQNVPWAEIASITLNEKCEPQVVGLELKIDEPTQPNLCESFVKVDADLYESGPKDIIIVTDATIDGDCLTISYSASGCSGDNWVVALYDSEAIAESDPEQRYLRLSMKNPESCLAVFEKEGSFDISELQIENMGVLILNFQDYEGSLRYEY